jgi:hypothetical protein
MLIIPLLAKIGKINAFGDKNKGILPLRITRMPNTEGMRYN